jgi:hypothetical protein
VTVEFAQVLKSYGLAHVTGDNYAGEWVVQAFHANGIRYERATKSKSEIYLEAQPHWNRGLISVPNASRLLRELRLLERRTHRSGRDTIDHGTNGTDDFANALCGCAWLAMQPPVPNFVGLQYHFDEFYAKHGRGGDAWAVAEANVAAGSAPCTTEISEPHPQTVERWARHAEYLRTVAAADARRRNQFAVDPGTGQSTIGRP